MISPCPQFHTPKGTECTDVPLTSSTGSQPMEWRTSSSSMERSEVMRRRGRSRAGRPRAEAARSISARRSTGSGAGRPPVLGRTGSQQAHRGAGGGIGSNSLNRRTRLPRRMHWSSASPWPSSRSVVIIDAPCSESRAELVPHPPAGEPPDGHVGLDRLLDLATPGWCRRYMELDPSVRYSVTQLAQTRTEATAAAMDTGAYPASTSLARRWPAR